MPAASPDHAHEAHLHRRASIHSALGEPARLSIVDELVVTDRSPKELGDRLGMPTNLLTHHLDVLESVGLVVRFTSSGDRRRKYVRLVRDPLGSLRPIVSPLSGSPLSGSPNPRRALFVCTHNSARSQLAAALWTARTGQPADSAGTHPADRVHRGAVAAGRRAGLDLSAARPKVLERIDASHQVVTVCDRAHEELEPAPDWWHWSIPDPVEVATPSAFDDVVADLGARIDALLDDPSHSPTSRPRNRPRNRPRDRPGHRPS